MIFKGKQRRAPSHAGGPFERGLAASHLPAFFKGSSRGCFNTSSPQNLPRSSSENPLPWGDSWPTGMVGGKEGFGVLKVDQNRDRWRFDFTTNLVPAVPGFWGLRVCAGCAGAVSGYLGQKCHLKRIFHTKIDLVPAVPGFFGLGDTGGHFGVEGHG